jgi:hypothetical protein
MVTTTAPSEHTTAAEQCLTRAARARELDDRVFAGLLLQEAQ